jgi:hypothetical protein
MRATARTHVLVAQRSVARYLGAAQIGVGRLRAGNQERQMTESQDTPQSEPFNTEELKRAFKAYKKRLKLTRADDESRLGYGPTSSGGSSGIVAITPPNQYPKALWDELVRQGKLKYAGQGMYERVNS